MHVTKIAINNVVFKIIFYIVDQFFMLSFGFQLYHLINIIYIFVIRLYD